MILNNPNPQSVEETLFNKFRIKVNRYKIHGTKDGGLLLRYVDRFGEERDVLLELDVFNQTSKLFNRLANAAYPVPTSSAEKTELQDLLRKVHPSHDVTYTQTTGWFKSCYVFGARTIGPENEKPSIRLHPEVIGQMPEVQSKGSLEDWIEFVARPAIGNSRMMFSLAIAFSASILELTGAEIKIFNFVGEGRIGKSTIAGVAASTVGGTGIAEGGIHKWNVSLQGMLALAYLHNDRPLVLDELSLIDPKMRGGIVHAIVEGRGKTRATPQGTRSPLDMRWRTMVLSTSNDTPDDYGMTAKRKTRDAILSRILDIPALPNGKFGIFESIPDEIDCKKILTGQVFSEYLKEASRTYYGTAFPEFVRRVSEELESDRSLLVTDLKKWIDKFVASTTHPGSGNMILNAAKAFGHIYAAGQLAIAYEILPFTNDDMLWAVQTCFQDHLQFRQAQELKTPPEKMLSIYEAMHMLHTFINDNRRKFIVYHKKGQETTDQAYADSTGFYTESIEGKLYWFKPPLLYVTVFSELNRGQLMKFLDEAGVLNLGNGNRVIRQVQFGSNIPRSHICIDFDKLEGFLFKPP